MSRVLATELPSAAFSPAVRVDEARLGRIVSAHFDVLWRFLRRLGVPESDVDDAVQEVILVVARKLDAVEPESERAFVLSTAFRVASGLRRLWRRRAEAGDAALFGLESDQPDPEHLSEQRELRRTLDAVLAELPLELRAVFVLYELEQMTMAEISTTLALPSGTVASRLRRAREKFELLAARAFPDGGAP